MSSPSVERQKLDDAWDKIGRIVPLTVGAYLVAYFVLSLIFAASLNATNGLFIVVLAVLLIVASVAEWRGVRLSRGARGATLVGSACVGLVVAAVVATL